MPQSHKLFYLLGCLPDGIKKEHLMSLWPHESDVEEGIQSFENLNFLSDDSNDKIALTNYLVEYVSETLDENSKKEMFTKICVFYTEFLKTLY